MAQRTAGAGTRMGQVAVGIAGIGQAGRVPLSLALHVFGTGKLLVLSCEALSAGLWLG